MRVCVCVRVCVSVCSAFLPNLQPVEQCNKIVYDILAVAVPMSAKRIHFFGHVFFLKCMLEPIMKLAALATAVPHHSLSLVQTSSGANLDPLVEKWRSQLQPLIGAIIINPVLTKVRSRYY